VPKFNPADSLTVGSVAVVVGLEESSLESVLKVTLKGRIVAEKVLLLYINIVAEKFYLYKSTSLLKIFYLCYISIVAKKSFIFVPYISNVAGKFFFVN
jgi:hypothetical protein